MKTKEQLINELKEADQALDKADQVYREAYQARIKANQAWNETYQALKEYKENT